MNRREKIERCANSNKKKSTVTDMANGPTYSDDDWIKAKELIGSNIDLLASNNFTEERSNLLTSIKDTVNVACNSLRTLSTVSASLHDFAETLVELLKIENVDVKIRFTVADILYTLYKKKLFELTSQNFITLISFLIKNCPTHINEKNMISMVRKLRKLLSNIHSDEILKADCVSQKHIILSSLQVLLQHVNFCVTDNGKEIVSHMVALDEITVNEFHACVKKMLLSCSKSDAFAFGKIYFRVWELAGEDTRKVLEDCIQWLMDRAFTLGRHENIVKYLSMNVQSLLTGLQFNRNRGKFSKVITTLYSPLIWKYLNCDNAAHRANAAEIFISVYPLERPGEGKSVYSRFLRKQHEEMMNLLDDPCPAIRVIAIRGICSNMKCLWITFQNGTIEQVLKKLITEMVMDGSSSDVRKAVFQGFTQLLENPESHKLLKGVLPSLSKFLHDENSGVRQAFLNMLLKIKNTPCEIKYFHIVDIDNIAARLENDTPSNQRLIVKLIYSSFFGPKIKLDDSIKRLCKFIDVNPVASRFLAMYSKELLQLKEATELMCLILIRIYMEVKKNMGISSAENKDSDENEKSESTRKSGTVLGSIENISEAGQATANENNPSDSSASSENDSKRIAVHNPNIAHGLFDFINVLWLYYGKRLQEAENKEFLDKLYTCSVKCVPLAFRFFRGTHAFFGVLNMAGVIPLIKIQHQTTVIGTCMSMLRQVSEDSPASELHCIIHVLCLWNRGADVLELSREWLDEGLRSQKLNESYCRREFTKSKRVKFSDTQAKPMLALRILEELFNSPYDQQIVFSKHTNELIDLLSYLSKIKILIEKRIKRDSELDDLLNDAFLKKALTLYGNLIIMFRENNVENFNFCRKIAEYFEWCDKTLGQGSELIVEDIEQEKCIGEFLQIPMIQCYNLVTLGKCDDKQLILLTTFYLTTLNSRCGMYCIEAAVIFVKQFLSFSRVHHCNNRVNEVTSVWFPRLMDTILELLTEKIYPKEVLSRYVKDTSDMNLVSLRRDFIFIYMLVTKLYPKLNHSSISYRVLHSFCNHLINIVLFPIRECETLNVDQSIKNLPPVGSLLAAVLISQAELASAFLFVLNKIIAEFTDNDALHLLAVASLLYTLALTQGKIKESEIMKVVRVTHDKLQNISAEEGCLALVMNHEQTIGDRTVIDIEETTELAVKEIGKHILKMIAEHLGGSLS